MLEFVRESIRADQCLACSSHCCSHNLINVCGSDIWRIATSLQVEPGAFLAFADMDGESPYNFKLDSSERAYCAALYPKQGPEGEPRCIFLMELPNRQTRCGIYALRPIACHAYPLTLVDEEVVVKPWAFCPPQGQDLRRLDAACWREELSRHDMEFSIYAYIVRTWNNEVVTRPSAVKPDFGSFLSFLIAVYSRLEVARGTMPEEAWPMIWNQWRWFTVKGLNPLSLEISPNASIESWSWWLQNIQEIVAESTREIGVHISELEKVS